MSKNTRCPVCGYKPAGSTKRARTIQQNRYYWGCVIPILVETLGYNKIEVHEVLKRQFLSHTIAYDTREGPETIDIVRSTQSLDTSEFEAFLSEIRTWASIKLEGCWIPTPNEGGYYD